MDEKTIVCYQNNSNYFIKQFQSKTPDIIHNLCLTFFKKEGDTVDIGCGSGRDLQFLHKNKFKVIGIDIVDEFLDYCKKTHPKITTVKSSLPNLSYVKDDSFDNVLINAVLMHLLGHDVVTSIQNILRITKASGRIVISTRTTGDPVKDREDDQRLFTHICWSKLIALFSSFGGELKFYEPNRDRDGKKWHNFVFEKIDLDKKSGIEKIQEILIRDKKTTSYKLALIRSIVHLARYERVSAQYAYEGQYVYLPLKRMAFYWLKFYFPLIKTLGPINRSSTKTNRLAFQNHVERLNYGPYEGAKIIHDYERGINRKKIDEVLKKISQTIKNNPMKYIGDKEYEIFKHISAKESSIFWKIEDLEHGMICVPIDIWRDATLYGYWIEDGLLIKWAELIQSFNKNKQLSSYFEILYKPLEDKRSTNEIRDFFKKRKSIKCVWSNRNIKNLEIDHMIPYSIWKNNSLWNLLPTTKKINQIKRDSIPSPKLLLQQKNCILDYWHQYAEHFDDYFKFQLQKSLIFEMGEKWGEESFDGLYEMVSRISNHKMAKTWDGRV